MNATKVAKWLIKSKTHPVKFTHEIKAETIRLAMEQFKGQVGQIEKVAKLLGITRTTVYYYLKCEEPPAESA